MVLLHRKIINKQRAYRGETRISKIFGFLPQEKQASSGTVRAQDVEKGRFRKS